MKQTLLAVCIVVLLCQDAVMAQEFQVGDRVYVTTLNKYGTVVEGGFHSSTGAFHPAVFLDDTKGTMVMDSRHLQLIQNQTSGNLAGAKPAAAAAPASVSGSQWESAQPVFPVAQPVFPAPQPGVTSSSGAQARAVAPVQRSDQSAAKHNSPVAPAASGKGSIPSGVYTCAKISSGAGLMGFGHVEIKGNTYRGLDLSGPFAPFTVDGGGNINWTAGLKGMEDVKIISSVYAGSDNLGRPMLYINYQASFAADRIDCIRE